MSNLSVKHQLPGPIQGSLPLWDKQTKQRIEEIALTNRILSARRISPEIAVEPGRYQLTLSITVPGQWKFDEIQQVLKLTSDWSWGGILDVKQTQELERLLDAVAGEVVS